jgi:hypothetical protein
MKQQQYVPNNATEINWFTTLARTHSETEKKSWRYAFKFMKQEFVKKTHKNFANLLRRNVCKEMQNLRQLQTHWRLPA